MRVLPIMQREDSVTEQWPVEKAALICPVFRTLTGDLTIIGFAAPMFHMKGQASQSVVRSRASRKAWRSRKRQIEAREVLK